MKALSIIGLILGSLLCLMALYLQFMVAPAVDYLEGVATGGDFDPITNALWMDANDSKMNMAYVALLGGGVTFIMCLVPFIKTKSKMALVGALLSFVALLIGIIQGTHMFS